MDKILSGPTTAGQSGPGNNEIEGVLHIPQSSITGASSTAYLLPYPGDSFAGYHPSAEM